MDSGAGTSTDRFRAFVSYAHADSARAGRLQSRLETYRIPETVGELPELDGARGDAVGPIFRDREDLSAAADLSEAVRDALAASQALVVVCTPNTPRSQWVSREIELFRSLHPDRPVLAALFEGEPKEAFPEALTAAGTEPLAADFRKAGDGDRLAFLKVVAGVLQVPLDRLIQRDAQRRVRRVTLVTAASLVLVLMMGAMTMFALQARNEAQSQREEAEGLIEYMLTDLRTELRGVGRLDVMEGVNERAMQYYEGQRNLAEFPDESIGRRARILHASAEDEMRRADGSPLKATQMFREAHAATGELLSRAPRDPDRIFEHAQSEFWLGYSHWINNQPRSVAPHWSAYLDLAERLAEVEPESVRSAMELGYAHGNMCELSVRLDRPLDQALHHCREAVRHQESAVKLDPDEQSIQLALANRYGWLADVELRAGAFGAAQRAREKEKSLISNALVADPANMRLSLRSTWPDLGMAEIMIKEGRTQAAVPMLSEVSRRLIRISDKMAGDKEAISTRMRSHLLLWHAGGNRADDPNYARALALYRDNRSTEAADLVERTWKVMHEGEEE